MYDNADEVYRPGDMVMVTCKFMARGRWLPVMEWSYSDGTAIQSKDMSDASNMHTHIEWVILSVNTSTNGLSVKCVVKMPDVMRQPPAEHPFPVLPEYWATNIPDYEFTFMTPAISVLCKYSQTHCCSYNQIHIHFIYSLYNREYCLMTKRETSQTSNFSKSNFLASTNV